MLPEKQSLDEFAFDLPDSIPFIDFWKIYVNFGYYVLLVPFKLRRNKESNRLEISEHRTQKILCGIVQSAILFEFLSVVWWSSHRSSTFDQLGHFNAFCYAAYAAYHLSLNTTFWWKQDAFRVVFANMQKLKFYDQTAKQTTRFWINFTATSISAFAIVVGMTDINLIKTLYTHHSFSRFYTDLQERAQLHFLFREKLDEEKSIVFQVFLQLFTFLQIAILIPSVVLVPYVDLFVLLVPICARKIMREFRQFCKNSMGAPNASERILKKYTSIRKFIKNLNRAMGIMICTCVSVSLPYYAAWIGVSFFETNVHPVMLLRVYAFFIIFFLALSLAADINKKGIEFFCWISSLENSDSVPTKAISSLLMDLHSNQLALKGSAFFVITFRFLGTIFGVIVTYSIITIQLQITRRANGYHTLRGEMLEHQCNCSQSSSNAGLG